MSKNKIVSLLLFLLFCQFIDSMEQYSEKSHLLQRLKKNFFAEDLSEKHDKILSLESLPPELKEYIFSFLPGNDRGLNYLVRWIAFYPSDQTIAKIEVAFSNTYLLFSINLISLLMSMM